MDKTNAVLAIDSVDIQAYATQDTNHKRILVVKNADRVKSYIKAMKTATGESFDGVVKNVDYKSVKRLASDVFFYRAALEGDSRTVISDMEATIILKKLLIENIDRGLCKYFRDRSFVTLSMAKELYKTLTFIRRNGWKSEKVKATIIENQDRFCDINNIMEKYEAYLQDKGLVDDTLLLNEALAYITTIPGDLANKKSVIVEICGGQVSNLQDDSEDNNKLENEFIQELVTITEGATVCLSKGNNIDSLAIAPEKVSFFKAYGAMNEANYVVNDIIENGYAFGDVKVLYTASSQQPFIEAAFKGNEIPSSFVSSVTLANNSVVDLCRKIIAWAKADYSEKALEQLMSNTSLFVEGYYQEKLDEVNESEAAVEDSDTEQEATASSEKEEQKLVEAYELTEEEKLAKQEKEELAKLGLKPYNYVGGKRYFQHVLTAKRRMDDSYNLGWGYERNCQFVNRELGILAKEKEEFDDAIENKTYPEVLSDAQLKKKEKDFVARKEVLMLHGALLDIFKEAETHPGRIGSPGAIYKDILAFIAKYVKKKSFDYIRAKNALYDIDTYLSREEDMPLGDMIAYLNDLLCNLTNNDKESYSCVAVDSLNTWKALDRPYVYVIGLSQQDIQASVSESPIIRDSEYDELFQGEYKPTVKSNIGKKNSDFYRSLLTFSGEKLSFGYSYFDVAGFCETNPSTIYRELVGKYNWDINKLPAFIYGKTSMAFKETQMNTMTPVATFIEESISNSSLESFISCPKAYAYEKRLGMRDNEIMDKDDTQFDWLNYAQRGTFFHNVAEEYVKNRMVLKKGISMPAMADEAYITALVEAEKKSTMEKVPYLCQELADDEAEDIKNAAIRYFNQLHKKRAATGTEYDWKSLEAELEFKDVDYQVESINKKKYKFVFRGFIDRVDYKVDESKKEVLIRVVDYKTGQKDKKATEEKLGKLSQHIVYKQAVLDEKVSVWILEKISGLEENEDIKSYQVVFDSFSYDFPYHDDIDACSLTIPDAAIETRNLQRLKVALTAMEDLKAYPDKVDIFNKTVEYCDDVSKATDELLNFKAGIMPSNSKIVKMSTDYKYGCDYCYYNHICEKRRAGEI